MAIFLLNLAVSFHLTLFVFSFIVTFIAPFLILLE